MKSYICAAKQPGFVLSSCCCSGYEDSTVVLFNMALILFFPIKECFNFSTDITRYQQKLIVRRLRMCTFNGIMWSQSLVDKSLAIFTPHSNATRVSDVDRDR